MMKTAIKTILIFGFCMLWIGTAWAIDKTNKGSASGSQKNAVAADKGDSSKPVDRRQPDGQVSGKTKKTHDDFIDANNNGIDDRAEKKPISDKSKQERPGTGKTDTKKKQ